ncbi:MAG: DUF234 domain-containing protein [Natronomonas sp.]
MGRNMLVAGGWKTDTEPYTDDSSPFDRAETIVPELPDHVATTFEDVCQEAVWEFIRRGEFPPYSDVGRWWYGEDESEIAGLAPNDDRILFAECKCTSEPVGKSLADDLPKKADNVRWGLSDRAEEFALFSKSGFVDGFTQDLDVNWSRINVDKLGHLFSAGDESP